MKATERFCEEVVYRMRALMRVTAFLLYKIRKVTVRTPLPDACPKGMNRNIEEVHPIG